jgi:hypothetical protein
MMGGDIAMYIYPVVFDNVHIGTQTTEEMKLMCTRQLHALNVMCGQVVGRNLRTGLQDGLLSLKLSQPRGVRRRQVHHHIIRRGTQSDLI